MGFLDFLKGETTLLQQIVSEARNQPTKSRYEQFSNFDSLASFQRVLSMSDADKDRFLSKLPDEIVSHWQKEKTFDLTTHWTYGIKIMTHMLTLYRPSHEALMHVAKGIKKMKSGDMSWYYIPAGKVLAAIKKEIGMSSLTSNLREALEALLIDENNYTQTDDLKNNQQIRFLLQEDSNLQVSNDDKWGREVLRYLNVCEEGLQQKWIALFRHINSAGEKSTPSAKWVKQATPLVDDIGREEFARSLESWLRIGQEYLQELHRNKDRKYLNLVNHELLKGLIWAAGIVNDSALNTALDEYAVWAYRKLPMIGSLSVKTGTAAMFAFSQLPVKEGVSRLSKFRTKIKNKSILKAIDKVIRDLSKSQGMSAAEMEEMAVPEFGIVDGKIRRAFGTYTAVFTLEEDDLTWVSGSKSQKTVPAEVRTNHGQDLKAFKAMTKEASELLAVTSSRLEQSYINQREWEFDNWKKLYIDHPLVSMIARKLIWHFRNDDQKTEGIWSNGEFIDQELNRIVWLGSGVKVQLWHPIGFAEAQVIAWRNYLRRKELVQPFKQAYREIYIVTDAELNTETYSNRFAAHIIRQHQFAALLRQRGWSYRLMGTFDSHNTPYIKIPSWSITAEYFVDASANEATSDMGIYQYVSTDQVRFVQNGASMRMQDVPALLFSEIMRDIDLFVGVASIGNDPTWQDGGNQFQNDYWRQYSFSELTESARVRRQVLESIIPSLKIAPVCSFDKKFLIVKGKIRTYKIHMGSGNILMEPNDQYLCIVPESRPAAKKGEKVFLPFEGDTILSIILSKAFMLAADDKITDSTITRQIGS